MFSQNPSSIKYFHKILFCRSLGFSLATGMDAGRGKAAYIWISPNLSKMELTLGGGGDVVVV